MSGADYDSEDFQALDEDFEVFGIIEQQPYDLVVQNEVEINEIEYELEQLDDIDDDPGYVSLNDLFDDGPGRSAGYQCNECPRVFNKNRGLGIHK